MSKENDAEDQLKALIDYLGNIDLASIKLSPENKLEDDIFNSVLSAIKDQRKFFIEVVKSFDMENLNAVLVYLYRQLIKIGVQVILLRDLNDITIKRDRKKNYVYMITERYLNISDEGTMKKVAALMSGHIPAEVSGIPIILALTENSLRLVDRYRSDYRPEFIFSNKGDENSTSPYTGIGFILLSLTFFMTLIGLIVDRPRVLFLSFSAVSWIIFSASLIAISGFVILIASSLKLPSGKAKIIAEIMVLIAILEIISIYLQVSGFSILPAPDGLHLAAPFPSTYSFLSSRIGNYVAVPVIYSFLSIALAFAFYFLFYRFSTELYRKIGIFALITAIVGEIISIISTYHGFAGYGLQYFVVHESDLLFLSFYNNVSPLMPYPSILLNITDFQFSFGKYSYDIFYLMLVSVCVSNFLFFISFLSAGLNNYGKSKQNANQYPVSGN